MTKLVLEIESSKEKVFSVRITQAVEREIIKRLATQLMKRNYSVGVHNGEEVVLKTNYRNTPDQIVKACCTTDDETLLVQGNHKHGWIKLIYGNGNDGLDLISDYTTNLEDVIKPVTDWIRELD